MHYLSKVGHSSLPAILPVKIIALPVKIGAELFNGSEQKVKVVWSRVLDLSTPLAVLGH